VRSGLPVIATVSTIVIVIARQNAKGTNHQGARRWASVLDIRTAFLSFWARFSRLHPLGLQISPRSSLVYQKNRRLEPTPAWTHTCVDRFSTQGIPQFCPPPPPSPQGSMRWRLVHLTPELMASPPHRCDSQPGATCDII
jgi:hypothetical protein